MQIFANHSERDASILTMCLAFISYVSQRQVIGETYVGSA